MTTIMAVLFIIGFMMGGFILGWCTCRERFNRIERGLDVLGNNILLAERDRRAEAESPVHLGGERISGTIYPPLEVLSPPPHPTGLTMDEMFERFFRGKTKVETKETKEPKLEREHKRKIQLRNDS